MPCTTFRTHAQKVGRGSYSGPSSFHRSFPPLFSFSFTMLLVYQFAKLIHSPLTIFEQFLRRNKGTKRMNGSVTLNLCLARWGYEFHPWCPHMYWEWSLQLCSLEYSLACSSAITEVWEILASSQTEQTQMPHPVEKHLARICVSTSGLQGSRTRMSTDHGYDPQQACVQTAPL